MACRKSSGKQVVDTLFFGYGLILDLIIIIGSLLNDHKRK